MNAGHPASPPYSPRHDHDFVDVVLGDLLAHFGEWRPLQRIFGCDPMDARPVHQAVEIGRRIGLQIQGDRTHRRRGYRLLGFRRIRYLRASALLEDAPLAGSDVGRASTAARIQPHCGACTSSQVMCAVQPQRPNTEGES